MDRRQAKTVREFREAHRVHAASSVAEDLIGSQLWVPQRNDDEGNETTIRPCTPLFNLVVVVGLDAQQRQFFVFGFSEGLTTKARQGGETQ